MTNLVIINDNAKLLQNEKYILETIILPHTQVTCMSSRLAQEIQRLECVNVCTITIHMITD